MFHRPKTEEKPAAKTEDVAPIVAAAREEQVRPAQQPVQQQPAQGTAPARQITPPTQTIQNTNNPKPVNQESKIEEKKMSKEDQQSPARTIEVPGTAGGYQPGQQPRIPGAYNPGSYPGAVSPNLYGSTASNKQVQGRRLVIGEGITMSGEIEACDYLVVEGTVEAALKGASVLEIAENGTFYGTVEIDEATVAGRFEGDITVNGRLTVTTTGSITGSIAYKELALEAGATLDGKVSPLASAKGGAGKKSETQPRPKSKDGRPRNDNEGNELPFASGSVAAE